MQSETINIMAPNGQTMRAYLDEKYASYKPVQVFTDNRTPEQKLQDEGASRRILKDPKA